MIRDGVYLSSGSLQSANGLLYAQATADPDAPDNSFQRLGLAASDDSEGGMVVYATVNKDEVPNYREGKSPYGFAIVRAQQLFGLAGSDTVSDPTGVTFASDQGIYVQGDFNNVNIQPASVLADSFYPLSNACITVNIAINHRTGRDCDREADAKTKISATDTDFYGGVLAGTDLTEGSQYNGGLENYPRFLENWSGITWLYRGSFVSIGQPVEVSGVWRTGPVYKPPIRDWNYDTDFNDSLNLPPLTPQFVVLQQESFIRSFEQ